MRTKLAQGRTAMWSAHQAIDSQASYEGSIPFARSNKFSGVR
jgi:hypothetical protein